MCAKVWLLTEVLRIDVERHRSIGPALSLVEQSVAQQFAMQHDVTLEETTMFPNVGIAVLRPIIKGGTCRRVYKKKIK